MATQNQKKVDCRSGFLPEAARSKPGVVERVQEQNTSNECLPQKNQRSSSVTYFGHQNSNPFLEELFRNCYENSKPASPNVVQHLNKGLRRHSSANCSITDSLSENDENKNYPQFPPPVPARTRIPPAVPQRKKVTCNIQEPCQSFQNPPPKIPPPHCSNNPKRAGSFRRQQQDERPVGTTNIQVSSSSVTEHQSKVAYVYGESRVAYPDSSEGSYFTFPKVTDAKEVKAEENFTLSRKKSGKKVPPPIKTNEDGVFNASEVGLSSPKGVKQSVRHDSTMSCSDGLSQTSSPSYIVRSLESPLLPIVKPSANRHLKKKFMAAERLFSEIAEFSSSSSSKRAELPPPPSADLPKSQSTPEGLQTVLDYQPGSLNTYQHKVIQNKSCSKTSISSGQLKFQFIQILINVLVLIAVGAGLACYFRVAYPPVTTVRYINNTMVQNVTPPPSPSKQPSRYYYFPSYNMPNEYGYYCTPYVSRFCRYHRVSYNFTMLPNYFGSLSERQADSELELYEAIANVRCYQLAPLFLCSLYLPKCGVSGFPVEPCQNLCYEMNKRCGLFMEIFGLQFPEKMDCSRFPMSDDPEVCIGYKEVLQNEIQERTVVCSDGFRCDERRCIPADWRCDGHIDCEDETDEFNCHQCPGQLHCGMGQCIATSHICDGVLNCPWAQDERNCVRLSKQMGDVGFGEVEIFEPSAKAFRPACISAWDSNVSPQLVCDLLGYRHTDYTTLDEKESTRAVTKVSYTSQDPTVNKIRLFQNMKSCNTSEYHTTIRAQCSIYSCGVRKEYLGLPRKRIIGGVQSNPGDWPFLAAILGGRKEIFYCAGVLISDQWVLSAAHCVGNFNISQSPKDWTVQLGMTRRFSHSYFGQKIKVVNVIPHPKYNLGIAHDNDVALFQLKHRVKFHEHLLPVCIPKESVVLKPPRNCTVIGWGKREDNEFSDYEPTVYEVQVPILSRSLCNKWLHKRSVNVTPGMICAGYEHGGKDACQGDSGGPLLCQDEKNPEKWFVGGIVSWGIKCAHPHLPGIYANVPKFVPWIEDQLQRYSY